ncbi:MAG: diguanylate cyclase, partial [Allorhizobium sp.]
MILNGFFKNLLACLFLVMLAKLGANAAYASDVTSLRPSCWAEAKLSDDPVAVARDEQRWSCSAAGQDFSIAAERVLLRFDIEPDQTPLRYLLSRRSALEAVHLLAIDKDGGIRQ